MMPTVIIRRSGSIRWARGPRPPEVAELLLGVGWVSVIVVEVYGPMNSYATERQSPSRRSATSPLHVLGRNYEDPGHHEPVEQPAVEERLSPPGQDPEESAADQSG